MLHHHRIAATAGTDEERSFRMAIPAMLLEAAQVTYLCNARALANSARGAQLPVQPAPLPMSVAPVGLIVRVCGSNVLKSMTPVSDV